MQSTGRKKKTKRNGQKLKCAIYSEMGVNMISLFFKYYVLCASQFVGYAILTYFFE
jgi:hypothetical protein